MVCRFCSRSLPSPLWYGAGLVPRLTRWQDRSRSIRRIGLIHCALALHALISLVQELLTIRTMGIPESHVSLVGSSISTLVNPVLAFGLLRRRQAARRLAIGWYVILSLIAVLVVAWLWPLRRRR